MQLDPPAGGAAVRAQLRAAACFLLAASAPATARAAGSTQLDVSTLLYGEQDLTRVVEPIFRITRILPSGHSLSAQFGLDVMTGASPTGALPSGQLQTTTSASGQVRTIAAGDVPVNSFDDKRVSVDAEWLKQFGTVTPSVTGHYSNEKDYRSVGTSVKFAIDLMQRLTTITVGAGINADDVFPVGGVPVALSTPGSAVVASTADKRVTSGLVGVSRVLSRRWMMSLNASRSEEEGYLTEPYKVVSLVVPAPVEPGDGEPEEDDDDGGSTGFIPTGQVTENRPASRARNSALASSVYHFTEDVLYLSYRFYWDDWDIRSHTADLRYRHELGSSHVEPHLRYYTQDAASFYTPGIPDDGPLPAYASSDMRLGPLRSATLGLAYGFHVGRTPGEWTLRGEYIRQFGDRSSGDDDDDDGTVGAGALPVVNIATLVVAYSIQF